MALASGCASNLPGALDLTPVQVTTVARSVGRLRNGGGESAGSGQRRRKGSPEQFKAALMGAMRG